MMRRLLAAVLLVAFASGQAQAGLLTLVHNGFTDTGSVFADPGDTVVTPIAVGTPFEIRLTFDASAGSSQPEGIWYYTPLSATVEVGGTPYSLTPASLGEFLIALADPTSTAFPGVYIPAFGAPFGSTGGLLPTYTAATPPISASAPSPTVFSPTDFAGFLASTVVLRTPSRDFLLVASPTNFSASFVSVPEPAGPLQLGLGAAGLAGLLARQRRRAAASLTHPSRFGREARDRARLGGRITGPIVRQC